jgi:hypothetical protein
MPVLSTPAAPTTNPAVIIQDVPFDDNNGAYNNAELSPAAPGIQSVWDDCVINCRYHKSQRRYMLGVTSSNTRVLSTGGGSSSQFDSSVAFVQLANPTLVWEVDWTVSRANSKPFAPSPVIPSYDWVLLSELMEPGQMTVGADGQAPRYRISGTYVYGKKNPSVSLNRDAFFPIALWVQKNRFDRSIPDAMFQQGFVGPLG